ncbi:hypothetical protein OUZ56_017166 [Daphnia magna]|uniref:Uncharacterized protein n=1 Tax=Daphnia magna TaxID=35525 RepID=A0ABR0ASR3_9CRUS|nr:hypothetical protein OUZ56_017166 [Daphnia magna]
MSIDDVFSRGSSTKKHSYCSGFSTSSFTDAGVELAERASYLAAVLNIIFGKFQKRFEVCGHSKVDNLEELVLLGVLEKVFEVTQFYVFHVRYTVDVSGNPKSRSVTIVQDDSLKATSACGLKMAFSLRISELFVEGASKKIKNGTKKAEVVDELNQVGLVLLPVVHHCSVGLFLRLSQCYLEWISAVTPIPKWLREMTSFE